MKKYINSKFAILTAVTFLFLANAIFSDKSKLKLESFDGHWQGQGTYYLPFTGIPTDIDATALFKFDDSNNFLRTQITAERFMMKYSDSGILAYIPKKDSVRWEIWNSFGYHVKYTGGVKENSIHGQRKWGNKIYDLYVNLVNEDSMKIKITSTDDDNEITEVANGYFKRSQIKKD